MFDLVIDQSGPWGELEKLEARLLAPAPLLEDIGEELLTSHHGRFVAQVSPDGTPFAPLSEDYQASKPRNKDKILILDGYLSGLLRYQIEGESLFFGSDRPYARRMHYGDEVPGIKARPWLGLSPADVAAIRELTVDFLSGR